MVSLLMQDLKFTLPIGKTLHKIEVWNRFLQLTNFRNVQPIARKYLGVI